MCMHADVHIQQKYTKHTHQVKERQQLSMTIAYIFYLCCTLTVGICYTSVLCLGQIRAAQNDFLVSEMYPYHVSSYVG